MKSYLTQVRKLQKIAGILKEDVYQDRPFTKKLYDECTKLNIFWEEDGDNPYYPIYVRDKKGRELWLRIDEKKKTIDAVAQGYKNDIPIDNIGKSGKDIADALSMLNSKWYKDNDR